MRFFTLLRAAEMATPLSSLKAFAAQCRWPSPESERFFAGNLPPSSLVLPRHPPASSLVALARRGSQNSANSSSSKKKKRGSSVRDSRDAGDDIDEDAFEKLFSMLAEDLKNDDDSIDDDVDDDISEEDFEKLQRELEDVLGIGDDDDVELMNSIGDDVEDSVDIEEEEEGEEEDEEEDEEEEERPVKLKNWQFRRLARALKNGRRKTSIKNLAAELCLDRAIVLDLLRDPPPNLVMMSATLPDEPKPIPVMPQTNTVEIEIDSVDEPIVDEMKSKKEKEVPVHVMRYSWNAQKRLKKVHIDTLERVYKRSKRPTNAMISSIVQVTNLPRKRVVKWFEDKRNEDGVPELHAPFKRSAFEAISSS